MMSQCSQQFTQTIEDFANSMQMKNRLEPAADGSFTFEFEQSGTLSLLPSQDDRHIFVALGRPPCSSDGTYLEKFLKSAGVDEDENQPLHAGISPNGQFYYVTVLPVQQFDLPGLESCLNRLIWVHDELNSN